MLANKVRVAVAIENRPELMINPAKATHTRNRFDDAVRARAE
jgi:3-dehydroquinate dehydratase